MNQAGESQPDYTASHDGFHYQNLVFPDFLHEGPGILNMMEFQGYSEDLATSPGHSEKKRKLPPEEDTHLPEETKQRKILSQEEQKRYVRQNHSEIEKRRRDKMNTYITELSSMIPTCVAMQRKMDKLTVLRLAVQHLKSIRGSLDAYSEGNSRPAMLTDSELRQLIVPSADGFIFVVDSARTRILYVSESVNNILNFSSQDLIGQSLFDILHPKDIDKVKEQLSNSDGPRSRLIDSKTMLPLKVGEIPQSIGRLQPGARRVFFCRMKCKPTQMIKQEDDIYPILNSNSVQPQENNGKKKKCGNSDKKYISIQCTGYLKSWPFTKVGLEGEFPDLDADSDTCMSCLVAVGRVQPSFQSTIEDCIERGETTSTAVEFFSRHGIDGKFSFVDQRVTLMLGYLPQELVGTSLYEHIQYDDIPLIAECHRKSLRNSDEVNTPIFGFRTKDGNFVKLKSKFKHFRNPWTREIDYIFCKNYLIFSKEKYSESSNFGSADTADMDFIMANNSGRHNGGTQTGAGNGGNSGVGANNGQIGKDIQQVISSHAEAAKIGRNIADEEIEKWRTDNSASNSPISSLQSGSPSTLQSSTSINPASSALGGKGEAELIREAMLDVERDRNKLSGVIVSRNSSTSNATLNRLVTNRARIDQIPAAALSARTSPPHSTSSSESGNDEAATAVLMSLLEAEGGLGGPFDFGSLPWPLP